MYIGMILTNFVLILGTILAAGAYSRNVRQSQETAKREQFLLSVDSMKQVSQNYLDGERGYVENWGYYITEQGMTLGEAMDFLRTINTNAERIAHIVDMETKQAWSSFYNTGEDEIETYKKFTTDDNAYDTRFLAVMDTLYSGNQASFSILGKYRLAETGTDAISVGTRITLSSPGGRRDYLLLRVIPTSVLKQDLEFSLESPSAEVGIISREGEYVVQSSSMKSSDFPEYIRGCNFQDNYNAVEELRTRLKETDSGMLYYKNFRGQECLWYYSSFGTDSELDILGMVPVDEIRYTVDNWPMVMIISGAYVLLMLLDGSYLIYINRRLLEALTLANQASEAKTQFLSAMSHDIRTPMNAVLGMMGLARRNVTDSDYVGDCLDKATKAGNQLLTLINDVLDISKIESGKVMLNLTEVCLDELMEGLMQMVMSYAGEKDVHIFGDYSDLPHRYVVADRMRLSQIYTNLLSNAVKYTNPGGQVKMTLREEEIPTDSQKTRLVFSLSDTGIGMSQEYQKVMYRTFTRAINTQVNRTQGTGLGLSIVKQMVDLMGGKIECVSAPGKGTTFTVWLDLAIAAPAKAETDGAQAVQADYRQMNLLVAEDNDLNWEIIQAFLEEFNVSSSRAVNGKQCVEMLCAVPPGTYSGIFMDIQMPVMNGLEAAAAIRALPEEQRRNIPIVAMTADAFTENIQECLDAGMNGHISKPISMEQLKKYLRCIQTGNWN